MKLIPLNIEPAIESIQTDMLDFHWGYAVKALFVIPDRDHEALQVAFRGQCIVRILDDFPLATEDESPTEGFVRGYFAYRVEDSAFFRAQSEAFKSMFPQTAAHYRFITQNTCLDVVTAAEPRFKVVQLRPVAAAEHARVGMPVYRKWSSWGSTGLFFERERPNEDHIGEVVLVGTFNDGSVSRRVAIIKVRSEFSEKRCKRNADGDLAVDPSIQRPFTEDGYVYQFLGNFGAPEYESLIKAVWWGQHAPKGPVIWDP